MRARIGDRLVVGAGRIGEVVGVPSADGAQFNFIVTAIAPGQTKLVATASGVSDTASVTVR